MSAVWNEIVESNDQFQMAVFVLERLSRSAAEIIAGHLGTEPFGCHDGLHIEAGKRVDELVETLLDMIGQRQSTLGVQRADLLFGKLRLSTFTQFRFAAVLPTLYSTLQSLFEVHVNPGCEQFSPIVPTVNTGCHPLGRLPGADDVARAEQAAGERLRRDRDGVEGEGQERPDGQCELVGGQVDLLLARDGTDGHGVRRDQQRRAQRECPDHERRAGVGGPADAGQVGAQRCSVTTRGPALTSA